MCGALYDLRMALARPMSIPGGGGGGGLDKGGGGRTLRTRGALSVLPESETTNDHTSKLELSCCLPLPCFLRPQHIQ